MTDDFVQSLGSMERLVQYTGGGRLATRRRWRRLSYFWAAEMASYISGVDLVVDYALNAGMLNGTKARYVFTKKKVMGEIT